MPVTERLIATILRAPRRALAVLIVLAAIAAVGASRVGVDNAVDIWFVEGDPALDAYAGFQEEFGNDEVVVLAIHRPDGVLTSEGMAAVAAASDAAQRVEGIATVRSLSTVDGFAGGGDWLDVSALYVPPIADDFAERVSTDPLLSGRLVSPDGKTALILATMDAMDDIDARRDGILANLRTQVDAVVPGTRYAGIGIIYAALNHLSTTGSAALIGASYAVIALMLWVIFRRIAAVLVTLGVVGLAALWLMGLYGAAGRDINMVTMILPTLMLIIGVSDCVHYFCHTSQQPADEDRPARLRRALTFMLWPCLLNTLTTAAGFASLATAPMPVVRDLGLFAAAGVVAAFVAATVGSAIGLLSPKVEPPPTPNAWIERGVRGLATLASERSALVLVIGLALLLVGALGITRLEVDTYSIDYLRADHPVRADSDAIEEEFGWYTPLEFVVEAPNALRDLELLNAVADWQDAMESDGTAAWTRSAVDPLRRFEQVLTDDTPESYRVPPNEMRLETALLLYESAPGSDLDETTAGPDRLRVTAGIPMSSARGIETSIAELTSRARLPERASIQPAGYLPLYVRIMESVVVSQLSSFGLAFALIFGLLAVLFRSIRLAALTVPANLVPIVFVLGVMGLVGIRLDVATVTLSAVVMGLVVDDTIQFLYRFRYEMRKRRDHKAAVFAAVTGVGRALGSTTLVLGTGFLVLALAPIKSVAWFGLLMALAMVAALFGDLLLLPAMLVLFKPRLQSLGVSPESVASAE